LERVKELQEMEMTGKNRVSTNDFSYFRIVWANYLFK
jgi:hypothetical protein